MNQVNCNVKTIGLSSGIMWLVATIASPIGIQIMAEYGFTSVIYYFIPSLLFFVPTAVATLELSNCCNNDGGMYSWVRDVLGKGYGVFVVWLQWTSVIVFYPVILSFLIEIILYMVNTQLLNKPNIMFILTLITGWLSILFNMSSLRISTFLSFLGGILAVVLPAVLVFIMAIIWLYTGNKSATMLGIKYLFPQNMSISTLSLLPSFIVAFAGIEYSSYFINNMRNSARNYPISIAAAVILIITLCVIGTIGIAVLVDVKKLNIIYAYMQAFYKFTTFYQIKYLANIIGILFCLGFVCVISTLMLSVAKGLLVISSEKALPSFLTKLNKNQAPHRIIFLQGITMSILCMLYLYLPVVNDVYWISGMLASILVGIKYIFLFMSALRARKYLTSNNFIYRLMFNDMIFNMLMCFGIIACITMIGLAFIPPQNILNIKYSTYDSILIISLLIILVLPIIAYWCIHKTNEVIV